MERLIATAMYARSTFIIIPLAFFCFIPVWQDAKSSPARLAAKVAAAFALMETVMFLIYFLFSSVIANIASAVLCIVIFFYLYQKEIALKRSHLWFIFMTACMVGGFTYLFYHLVNIFFHPAATVDDPAFTDTFFLQLAFESLLILILALPTRRYLGWLVHHFHEEKVWRVIWLIPASFLAFSYIFIPYDNSVMFVGRFLEIYIITIFILFIIILLIYGLFYKIAHSITENQKMTLKTANLEIQAQRKYRRRLRIFGAVAGMTLLCAAGGTALSVEAGRKLENVYDNLMHMAEISSDSVEACRLYFDAVAIDESRQDAYHAFYARAVEDGVFSEAEEELFLKMGISTHQYLQHFQEKNEQEYADFCYEIGNAYWYYYEHEESRQARAVSWFQTAQDYYAQDSAKAAEYRRCKLYVELGTFYKTVIASQIDGTDAGMYGKYWDSLVELKKLNDSEPDREIITLRMYREIASRVVEYVKYFREDGVTSEEVIAMLEGVEEDIKQMEQSATSAIHQEIQTIRWILDGAHKMVRSTYQIQY